MALDLGQPSGVGGAAVSSGAQASTAVGGGRSRILDEARKDPGWGTFLWLAMTVGARRGELCGLRRRHVDLNGAVLTVEISIGGRRSDTRQKDTARQDDHLRSLGLKAARDPFLFSLDPGCGRPCYRILFLSASTVLCAASTSTLRCTSCATTTPPS